VGEHKEHDSVGHHSPKPGKRQISRRAGRLVALAGAAFLSALAPGKAAAQGLPLIRDTEIENLLNDYARPIFKAAGLGTGRIAMRIINNDQFNAFVLDGRNVFIHTGALMQAQTPNEVIGVIAHESGHITGGHMAALRARIAQDQTRALLMQLLGIGMMVAGGVAGGEAGREIGSGGGGVLLGGNETIMRGLLAERRSQESAADQAGLKRLEETHQSGKGMLETFERFAAQEYLSDAQKDAYVRTHPVAAERLSRLREIVAKSPYVNTKDSPELQLRHDLMRAKLSGYMERPQIVLNRYPTTDNSLPARYGRALAHFHQGERGVELGLAEMDALIREQPSNPYFLEVKADMLAKSGRVREAIGPLRAALKLLPSAALMRVDLAAALENEHNPAMTTEAVDLLKKSMVDDPENSRAYMLLANAYAEQNKEPEALAMTAQARFLDGNIKDAQNFAKRAQIKLKPGSPEWLKNDDVINYKPPQT
jgi:predicted Zn-dependent protease